ncbi:MAG TPA: ester cyclase [Ohtaekwangia sp.]|uniref:ester cyclase n=1 Tax=Ohtaekwangia sp. TaxID=2066019 RepID=UPI002F93EE3A
MDQQRQKQIAKEWHEAFGTEALKYNYDKYLHDNFVADFFGGSQVNKMKYMEEDQRFASAFTNNRITVVEQIAEDNKVVSIMTWTAVQTGDLPGIPASGKSFEIKGIAIDYFKDGKVIKHFPLFDQLSMMQQLGAMSESEK